MVVAVYQCDLLSVWFIRHSMVTIDGLVANEDINYPFEEYKLDYLFIWTGQWLSRFCDTNNTAIKIFTVNSVVIADETLLNVEC